MTIAPAPAGSRAALMRPSIAVSTAALALGSIGAGAQTSTAAATATSPVIVIVRVPAPWYAPRALITRKMRDSIPQYERIAGLQFKAFSFERESGDFGGVYAWSDKAAAQSWFTPQWFERVRKERGHEAKVRYFDAPVTIDNTAGGTQGDVDSKGVVTVVEIPAQAGTGREQLVNAFKAAIPVYQNVPGLVCKHFTISDTGAFGGVYLWKDEGSARAWFNQAWHAQVLAKYRQPAKIGWFDTPILAPSRMAVAP